MNTIPRSIAGAGLCFTALFVAGALLLGEFFGGFADSDAFFVAYYSNHSHHFRDLLGGHLFVASALSLLLFVLQLSRHLRALGASEAALDAARAAGITTVTLLLAGAAAMMTVTMAQAFGRLTGDKPLTSPAVALAPQLGSVLIFFPALWAAAFTIGLIVWSVWTNRIWPRALCWFSLSVAVLLPLSWLAFVPIVFLPAWVLGVSIWVWRSSSGKPGLRASAAGGGIRQEIHR